jgi:hypothetical protein
MNFDPSKWEPLLDDDRVERLAEKLRSQFGHKTLADSTFFTFIQPARSYTGQTPGGLQAPAWIPDMAVFAVISPRPNGRPGQKLMSTATVSLQDWLETEAQATHYVGVPDEAHQIFRAVVRDHLAKMQSAKELIH